MKHNTTRSTLYAMALAASGAVGLFAPGCAADPSATESTTQNTTETTVAALKAATGTGFRDVKLSGVITSNLGQNQYTLNDGTGIAVVAVGPTSASGPTLSVNGRFQVFGQFKPGLLSQLGMPLIQLYSVTSEGGDTDTIRTPGSAPWERGDDDDDTKGDDTEGDDDEGDDDTNDTEGDDDEGDDDDDDHGGAKGDDDDDDDDDCAKGDDDEAEGPRPPKGPMPPPRDDDNAGETEGEDLPPPPRGPEAGEGEGDTSGDLPPPPPPKGTEGPRPPKPGELPPPPAGDTSGDGDTTDDAE